MGSSPVALSPGSKRKGAQGAVLDAHDAQAQTTTASVMGEPDINYESVENSGSLQYARLAVHPMLDPDDPACRAL